MLQAYVEHVAERAALGIPPLPLSAKQTADLIELIKAAPAKEEAFLLDLLTHPFSPGNNPGSVPFLFRWLSAIAGTFTVIVAVFILRRVPVNINGPLLLLFGVGAAGWSLRMDFGSPTATGLIQLVFGFYFFCASFPALVALIFHYPTGQAFPQRLSGWVWGLNLTFPICFPPKTYPYCHCSVIRGCSEAVKARGAMSNPSASNQTVPG